MGVQKRARKFATTKRMIGTKDSRLKANIAKNEEEAKKKRQQAAGDELVREMYASLPSPPSYPY